MNPEPVKITAIPADALGMPGIWISDADPIDAALTRNAVVMLKTARALLDGPGTMGSGELRYMSVALCQSLRDLLNVLDVDTEE